MCSGGQGDRAALARLLSTRRSLDRRLLPPRPEFHLPERPTRWQEPGSAGSAEGSAPPPPALSPSSGPACAAVASSAASQGRALAQAARMSAALQ